MPFAEDDFVKSDQMPGEGFGYVLYGTPGSDDDGLWDMPDFWRGVVTGCIAEAVAILLLFWLFLK